MKRVNQRNVVWRVSFLATLSFTLAAVASAQNQGVCSADRVAGEWGHTFTGTLITPTGAIPFAAVGRSTIDAAGNVSGTQHSSQGGAVSQDTIKGTLPVNSDCTGTLTVGIYGPSGNLLRTAVWAVVLDDNAREFRAILTSLVPQPSGTSVPAVITLDARKLLPGRGDEREE